MCEEEKKFSYTVEKVVWYEKQRRVMNIPMNYRKQKMVMVKEEVKNIQDDFINIK
jgi:hypothetical protein